MMKGSWYLICLSLLAAGVVISRSSPVSQSIPVSQPIPMSQLIPVRQSIPANKMAIPASVTAITEGTNKMAIPASVTAITEGTNNLKKVLQAIQQLDNLKYKTLDDMIEKYEKTIENFPFEVSKYKDTLQHLYSIQDAIVIIRVHLEAFANQLTSQCEGLLKIYNRNANEVSIEFLNYSVTKFLKLARNVQLILEDANKLLTNLQNDIRGTQANLSKQKITIQNIPRQHEEELREEIDDVKWYVKWYDIIISLITNTWVRHEIQVVPLEDAIKDLTDNMDNLNGILSGLVNHNKQLRQYIGAGITLVKNWKMKLEVSISDHEDGITPEDIKWGIGYIKENLIALIKACEEYIQHELYEDIVPEDFTPILDSVAKVSPGSDLSMNQTLITQPNATLDSVTKSSLRSDLSMN